MPLSSVRKLIEDRELLAPRVGERRVVAVPARFLDETALPPPQGHLHRARRRRHARRGDPALAASPPTTTLPVPGSPLDALGAGFKTEVRRRAMEQAF